MGLREAIQDKPIVGVIAVVVLLFAGFMMVRGRFIRDPGVGMEYYYDLSKGELILYPLGHEPPVQTAEGGKAVRAHVFACTSCDDKEKFFYIEMMTDEAKEAMLAARGREDPGNLAQIENFGRLVAEKPEGGEPQWVASGSAQGQALTQAYMNARNRCNGKLPLICRP